LAVLLLAIATGKLVLGLLTVLVFSLGFASVLVVVGLLAAKAGQLVLGRWGGGQWLDWLQLATAVLIVGVGVVLTVGAWRVVSGQ
jgi:nickel/cobalt transporter (NicO) family protein